MAGSINTKQRRIRPAAASGARALAGIVGFASAGAALAAAGACLPDLAVFPEEGGAFEDVVLRPACGDGVIMTSNDGGVAESCDPGEDAEAPGCKNCEVTCKGGRVDPKSGHCYFPLERNDTDFKDAVTRCKNERAHVVTLTSDEEVTFVGQLAASGYWVGLEYRDSRGAYLPDRPEEPGYPGANAGPCPGCFAVGADEAGVLPVSPPDASNTSCVASAAGGWSLVPCSGPARVTVCEREPAGIRALDCVIGGFCFSVPATSVPGTTKKTYVVFISTAGPDAAADTCSSFDGGSLVVLQSREEREQVAHEILARYPEEVEQQLWIGLRESGGVWRWEDGISASEDAGRPPPWGNDQPDGAPPGARAFMRLAATAYDTQLAYADDGGGAQRLFICQRPAQ